MTIIPADRQEFDKNLTIVQVFNFQAVHSLKATARSPTCSPQLTPPGITQVSHRWVRCSFLFGSDEMIFQICGLLDLVRDRLVPLIELVL